MVPVYHSGELAIQARAGRRDMADRVGKSIRSTIPPAAQEFLRSQPMAILGSIDPAGRLWTSMLTGAPGFMQPVDVSTVRIDTSPALGDPLAENLASAGRVGMLVIDLATRRRMRLNGMAETQSDGFIQIHARQVYANCPKYIQVREWENRNTKPSTARTVRRELSLTERQQRWIGEADTFFIASGHPDGGLDASHRGGNPGFVRVLNPRLIVWPDYAGNMMFQTLGNIAADPHAGLLFIDFENGSTLQLTGRARLIWDTDRMAEFPGAERIIEFDIDEVVEVTATIPLRWRFIEFSPFNPGG
jgi:uncharacterized protein